VDLGVQLAAADLGEHLHHLGVALAEDGRQLGDGEAGVAPAGRLEGEALELVDADLWEKKCDKFPCFITLAHADAV
jgi:hypothetical protein